MVTSSSAAMVEVAIVEVAIVEVAMVEHAMVGLKSATSTVARLAIAAL